MTRIGSTTTLRKQLATCKENNCSVEFDAKKGTAKAMDGNTSILTALQLGRGCNWIFHYQNSERIQWPTS